MAEQLIDLMLQYHRAARFYPGAVVHVERDGKVLARRIFGSLHGDDGSEPMREDARFRVASLTKPVVSLAVLQLVDEGRVDLDAPIYLYVPALQRLRLADGSAPQRPPTVRDCLRHTSGLAYTFELRDPAQLALAKSLDLDARLPLLDSNQFTDLLAQWPLAFEPGSAFRYGFSTDALGLLIENLHGKRLGDALAQRVFEPLGMRDTRFGLDRADKPRFATAFDTDKAWFGFVERYAAADEAGTPFHSGGGGLVSTLDDYAKFARLLAHGGAPLLKTQTASLMFTDQLGPRIDGPGGFVGAGFGFGLGLAVRLPTGSSAIPSEAGEGTWSGITGMSLFIAPRSKWFALSLTCNMASRVIARLEFRRAVAALG